MSAAGQIHFLFDLLIQRVFVQKSRKMTRRFWISVIITGMEFLTDEGEIAPSGGGPDLGTADSKNPPMIF